MIVLHLDDETHSDALHVLSGTDASRIEMLDLKRILESGGDSVFTCSYGQALLDEVQRLGTTVDAIIVDISVPMNENDSVSQSRYGGIEVIARLLGFLERGWIRQDTIIRILSRHNPEHVIEACVQHGIDASYIARLRPVTKPVLYTHDFVMRLLTAYRT